MDFGILKIKLFNVFLILLIAIQLVVSVGVIALMLNSTNPSISTLQMVASSAFLLLFCLPIPIYLYWSSKDRVLKMIFAGVGAGFAFMTLSGILGYVLPMVFNAAWVRPVSELFMLLSYMPIIYVLGTVLREQHKKVQPYAKAFIIFINVALALMVIYFVAIGIKEATAFDTAAYTISMLADIAIFAMSSMLILVYLPTKFRYLISMIFTYNVFSFVGDALKLMAVLGMYDYSKYSDLFYIGMLTFASTALLLYLFSNIKTVTVEEINKKLNNARLLLDTIIEQSPIGACICDTNGEVMMANKSFLKIFDKNYSDFVGKANIFEFAAGLGDQVVPFFMRMQRGETVEEDGVKVNARNAQDTFISLKMFSTYDTEGARSSFVVMAEDVTGRKHAESELVNARDQAELYMDLMGHDINNMNQIGIGYLEMAIGTLQVEDEQRVLLIKPLEVMASSSQLIDNVRKLRRTMTQEGEFKLVDMEKVLSSVVKEYNVMPGRDFIIKYEMVEKCYVMADDMLKDVFMNLLNNAVKHSKGPLLVRVELKPLFQFGEKHYRVTIEDNGPGIPDKQKPRIFDGAYRSKTKDAYSGLGLYLVKMLVDRYHGSVAMEDRVKGDSKQGSRFIITLPAAPESPDV